MKLWLDDQRDPKHPYIQQKYGAKGDELWVKTATEAMNCLETLQVESISFDHDLGDDIEIGTGYDVAKYIEQEAYRGRFKRIQWRVHSSNPVGARRIIAAMQSADRYWEQHEQSGRAS